VNKRIFLAVLAALFAIRSYAARERPFFTGGPEGGVVLRLVFSPDDPNIVLACGFYGALYYSEDGGQTWTRTADAGVLGSTYSAAFDPATPSVAYAGASGGVARSTDSGKTWSSASSGLPQSRVPCLVVDAAHPGTVLACTISGIFRTTDSGASWVPFGTGLPSGKEIDALSVDPGNSQTLLAATSYDTVFRSTDGGATWAHVAGLPASPSIDQVAFDPTTAGRAFAGASKVYRSTDHGASWNAVSDSSFLGTVSQFAFLPGTILAATNDALEKSTNGGISWTTLHNGIPPGETFFNGVSVSPGASPVVLAGVEANGVLRSIDGGASWTVAKSGIVGNVAPLSVAFDPTNPERAVAGLDFSGSVRTADGGRSWTWIPDLGFTVRAVVAVPGAAGRFVAGSFGAYRSTDGGVTWHAGSPQIPDTVYSLAVSTSGTHPVFAGTANAGIWRSTDAGGSWHSSSPGLTSATVTALGAGPTPASIVYAGLVGGSIWKSTDSGVSWHPAGASPDSAAVRSLTPDPNHVNVLFAGTDQGLYRSTDGGASWTNLESAVGSSQEAVFGIAMPANLPDTVFATVYGSGVYVSRDGGDTWEPLDANFQRFLYTYLAISIACDATGQWIYEGSQSAGVFQMSPVTITPVVGPVPGEVGEH
jgi:photosystem II stability/assembly factor-like uncharacterized protein